MPFENDENQSLNNPMSWENNVANGGSRINANPNAYIAQQNSIQESCNNQSISNTMAEQESGMFSMVNTRSENTQSENSHPESVKHSGWRTSTTDNISTPLDVDSSNLNTVQANTSDSVDNDNQSSLNDTKPFTPSITRRESVSKYSKTPSEQMIIFSDRAYNAIISEAFAKDPVETGGILIGHVLNNGFWIVTEVIPPGKSSINEYAYFEYDTSFVNYVANRVAIQFEIPPRVLGLWHRHPGSMDHFSSTDDGTNKTFASLDRNNGAVSALVNIDPDFRITIYHATINSHTGVHYETMPYEVGDGLIPEEYFKLKYYPEFGKNPALSKRQRSQKHVVPQQQQSNVTDMGTTNSVTSQVSDMENRDPFQEGSASDSGSHSTPLNICNSILTFILCVLLAFCIITSVMFIHDKYNKSNPSCDTQSQPVTQQVRQTSNVDNSSMQLVPERPIGGTMYHMDNKNVPQSESKPIPTVIPPNQVISTNNVSTDNNIETVGVTTIPPAVQTQSNPMNQNPNNQGSMNQDSNNNSPQMPQAYGVQSDVELKDTNVPSN